MSLIALRAGDLDLQVEADAGMRLTDHATGSVMAFGRHGLQEKGSNENGLCWSHHDRMIGEQYACTYVGTRLDERRVRFAVVHELGQRMGGFTVRFDLAATALDVVIEDIDDALPSLCFPNPIASQSLVLPIGAGIWQRTPLPRFARRIDRCCGNDLRMRFVGGYLDANAGWIAILHRGHTDAGVLRAGGGVAPIWLRSLGTWNTQRTVRYAFCRDGYVGMAHAFRAWCRDHGLLVTLADKMQTRPHLRRILGKRKISMLFALPDWEEVLDREWRPRTPHTTPEAGGPHICTTFAQGRAMFDEATRDGWRGLAQIVGWCHGGWDAYFPHAWPPEPGCGAGFADLFRSHDSHVAGILDNYADTYARAPGFPEGVIRRADGSLLEGGIWSGGQCYLLDYRQVLPVARANAAHYRQAGVQGIYCDTTTAVQLYENHDPAHRGTRADDEAARLALLMMFRDQGLTIGSEKGCDFGIPVVDWSPSGFRYQPGETIPLWPLVFHDCHIQFCPALGVEPEATAPYTPELLERHRRAWLPYLCHGHQLGHVRVTHGNWHLHRELIRGMAWVDAISTRIGGVAMTDHRILAPGVERSTWANGSAITINTTDQPASVDGRDVPAQGYVAD